MKDLGDASYTFGIEIHRDRSKGFIGTVKKRVIEKVLKQFNISTFGSVEMPISKGDKLSREQFPKNEIEKMGMKFSLV